MIVVDTSALVAIYLAEAEADRFASVIARSGRALVATPNALEFKMVALGKKGATNIGLADRLLSMRPISVVAWDEQHLTFAIRAFDEFGKGRHPAGLNFGDCMAYALAKALNAPLLFKGNDFVQTDIRSALD